MWNPGLRTDEKMAQDKDKEAQKERGTKQNCIPVSRETRRSK